MLTWEMVKGWLWTLLKIYGWYWIIVLGVGIILIVIEGVYVLMSRAEKEEGEDDEGDE